MRERSTAPVSDKRNFLVVGWVVNLVFRVLSYFGGSKISDIQLIIIVNRGKCSTIWQKKILMTQNSRFLCKFQKYTRFKKMSIRNSKIQIYTESEVKSIS